MHRRDGHMMQEPVVLSSQEGLAKHAWDTAQEHILKKWKCQLFVHMYMQAEARAYYRTLYNWMSTPVILLNTSASAAIFVSSRSNVKDYVLLAMTLSAAILATLTRSMQVAELYQQHGSSCLRYSSLLHDIESVLNMRVDLRPSALSYVEKVKCDMDNIMSAQAEPPEHVVHSFERTYGRVDGLLYGEDVVRVVLTNMRTNSYLQDIYTQTQMQGQGQGLGLGKHMHSHNPVIPHQSPALSGGQVPVSCWSLLPYLKPNFVSGARPTFLKMTNPPEKSSTSPASSPFQSEEFRRIVASVDRIHVSIDNQQRNGTTTNGLGLDRGDRAGAASDRDRDRDRARGADVVLSMFESSPTTSLFERSLDDDRPASKGLRVASSSILWDTAADIDRGTVASDASSTAPRLLACTGLPSVTPVVVAPTPTSPPSPTLALAPAGLEGPLDPR